MAPSPHPIIVLRDAQATVATAAVGSVVALTIVGASLLQDWALVLVLVLGLLLVGALRHLPPTTCRIALDGVEFRWPLRRVRLDARALAVPVRTRPSVSVIRVRPGRSLPFVVVLDAWSSPLILRTALAVRFEHAVPGGFGGGPGDRALRSVGQRTT